MNDEVCDYNSYINNDILNDENMINKVLRVVNFSRFKNDISVW